MKTETAIIITVTICISLSFYFVILSLQTTEDTLKKQLANLAVYSLLAGIMLFASLTIQLAIKKALSRVGQQLKTSEETSEHEKD